MILEVSSVPTVPNKCGFYHIWRSGHSVWKTVGINQGSYITNTSNTTIDKSNIFLTGHIDLKLDACIIRSFVIFTNPWWDREEIFRIVGLDASIEDHRMQHLCIRCSGVHSQMLNLEMMRIYQDIEWMNELQTKTATFEQGSDEIFMRAY